MSRLTDFYRGTAADAQGRTIDAVWRFDDHEMEIHHDFIQWLFPLREASRFNPSAPTLDDADIAAFHAEPALRTNVRRSFDRFLAFVGLDGSPGSIRPAADFAHKRDLWCRPNHNWLRITRVLHSLRLLGLDAEAAAFFDAIRALRSQGLARVSEDTWSYWQHAAR